MICIYYHFTTPLHASPHHYSTAESRCFIRSFNKNNMRNNSSRQQPKINLFKIETHLKGTKGGRKLFSPQQSPLQTNSNFYPSSPCQMSEPKLRNRKEDPPQPNKREQYLSQLMEYSNPQQNTSQNMHDGHNLAFVEQINALQHKKKGRYFFQRYRYSDKDRSRVDTPEKDNSKERDCDKPSESTEPTAGCKPADKSSLCTEQLHYEMVLAQQRCKKLQKQ